MKLASTFVKEIILSFSPNSLSILLTTILLFLYDAMNKKMILFYLQLRAGWLAACCICVISYKLCPNYSNQEWISDWTIDMMRCPAKSMARDGNVIYGNVSNICKWGGKLSPNRISNLDLETALCFIILIQKFSMLS